MDVILEIIFNEIYRRNIISKYVLIILLQTTAFVFRRDQFRSSLGIEFQNPHRPEQRPFRGMWLRLFL